jgi:catechol 2,3-dioxygenase-like lactoylglutathione lyase family enzyme
VFGRVTVRAADRESSARFYDTVLPVIGGWGEFRVVQASEAAPLTRRLHIGFYAPSREHVDAFWRAGVDAGYRDDGTPGPRPQYSADYYGGFLLDPDGNSAEAVHHGWPRTGRIDHLWIRVADVAASRRFYERISTQTGFVLGIQLPERVHFKSSSGASFGLVAGTPTEHVRLGLARDAHAVEVVHDPDGNEVELPA